MEIMVVIGILLLLMALGVMGYRSLDRSAATRQTRVTLGNLNAMLANYEAVNGLGQLGAGAVLDNPGEATKASNTATVLGTLLTMAKNKAAMEAMPAKVVYNRTTVLDGWGNGIYFVPSAGVKQARGAYDSGRTYVVGEVVTEGTGPTAKSYRATQQAQGKAVTDTAYWSPFAGEAIIRAPSGRPFWMSAGADGDFSRPDDNIYSFDQ